MNIFFFLVTDRKCYNCSNACSSCTGPNPSDCIMCSVNFFKKDGLCQASCPNTYYPDTVLRTCVLCEGYCLTCSKSTTNCTSCKVNSYFNSTAYICST